MLRNMMEVLRIIRNEETGCDLIRFDPRFLSDEKSIQAMEESVELLQWAIEQVKVKSVGTDGLEHAPDPNFYNLEGYVGRYKR